MGKRRPKTELEHQLVYGIDEKNRRIHFGAALGTSDEDNMNFSQTSVAYAIRSIRKMSSRFDTFIYKCC